MSSPVLMPTASPTCNQEAPIRQIHWGASPLFSSTDESNSCKMPMVAMFAANFTTPVASILDVLHNNHPERISLNGIAFGTTTLESFNHDLLWSLFPSQSLNRIVGTKIKQPRCPDP